MNILLVEDHELFREGLKFLLAELGDGISFAEAPDCLTALELSGTQRFDIILLDFHMPGLCGFNALRALRDAAESASIVVLSGEDDPTLIRGVIDEGASGFIPKASSHAVMMAALRLILAGGTFLPPHALSLAPSSAPPPDPGAPISLDSLTERQTQTLRLAMQGKNNRVIARELNVSEATVKAHLAAAFRALDVRNRTEAVFVAARLGLKL